MRTRILVLLTAALVTLTGCGPAVAPAGVPAPAGTQPSAAVSTYQPEPTEAPTTQAPTPAAPPVAPATTAAAAAGGSGGGSGGGGTTACGAGYYRNVDGNCVPRPAPAPAHPAGATAQCNDGTYSYSQHRQGTCSHHGGVRIWY